MITKEGVTVYSCEHCNHKLFLKHAMEKHEKWCAKNPENIAACQGCVFIEKTTIEYEVYSSEWNAYMTTTSKAFRCKKLDKMLYPKRAEKKGLIEKYPETFEGQYPMPTTCEHRDDITF